MSAPKMLVADNIDELYIMYELEPKVIVFNTFYEYSLYLNQYL